MPTLAATHILTSNSDSGASSFTTATVTTVARTLTCAIVHNVKVGTGDIPSLSGCGMNWSLATTGLGGGGSIERMSLFVATSPTPVATAVVIDFAGASQVKCYWSFFYITNADVTGHDALNAIVPNNAGTTFNASSTTGLHTLAAFSHTKNGTICGGRADGLGTGHAAGTGFTELGSSQNSSFIVSSFAPDNRTAVTWSETAGATDLLTLGAEVRVAQEDIRNYRRVRTRRNRFAGAIPTIQDKQ